MWVNEEVVHYVVYFLNRSDVDNKSHKEALKQFRQVSDSLLERLYKPLSINVIRKPKPEPEKEKD